MTKNPKNLALSEVLDIEKIKATVFEAINFDSNPKAWLVVLKKEY